MSTSADGLPFDDSRRLTGSNLYFADVGAVLEVVGVAVDAALLDGWRSRVSRARATVGWPAGESIVRVHVGGASLAISAPLDQLLTATDVNEWALAAAVPASTSRATLHAPGHASAWDEHAALNTLAALARAERQPHVMSLVERGHARGLTVLIDEDTLSIGAGTGSRAWPLDALPEVDAVDWNALHNVPIALVTGSNGKTTTVRLLAAIVREHGWHSGHSCTDGLFVDGVESAGGDYSGPAGARAVLRDTRVDAAVLETARGGILRRGIAVQRADVAIVTNVSDDHFGEYGIHDLDGLADVKLAVARTIGADGLLVLNADDALLVRKADQLGCRLAWFALDDAHPHLRAQRERGAATASVRDGRLHAWFGGVDHDLGRVDAMPLAFGGVAGYNISNIAAAALAALQLGIDATTIAAVLARFGAANDDNPGRLQHWSFGHARVLLDYAHNPDGLRGLLRVATAGAPGARLGLLLGQAGNREDAEIRELAAVAASFAPAQVVLKDIAAMLRGRPAGAVPKILEAALRADGVTPADIIVCLDEYAAARTLLAWMRDGDRVVLPIHSADARRRITAVLDRLVAAGWRAGTPLPADI